MRKTHAQRVASTIGYRGSNRTPRRRRNWQLAGYAAGRATRFERSFGASKWRGRRGRGSTRYSPYLIREKADTA